jgi:predicted house-cleaning noncanonical NTP pyrophosphatase (MazG superfamily)
MGKLVRNNIPAIIKAQTGIAPKTRKLIGMEAVRAILDKLAEEACELRDARQRKDVREELADFSEIFDTALRELRVSREDLELIKAKKRALKGGFDDLIYMEN